MVPDKKQSTNDKEPQPRKRAFETHEEGIDGQGHHLRAADDADFEDSERDSCTVIRHRDDKVSDS